MVVMCVEINFGLLFMKMYGLGNDFVIIDECSGEFIVDVVIVVVIVDCYCGVGFDQFVIFYYGDDLDLYLIFWNVDGLKLVVCGNVIWCIVWWEMDWMGKFDLIFIIECGMLFVLDVGDGLIFVNMGYLQLSWDEVLLVCEMDILCLFIEGELIVIGMGNLYCMFFVDDVEVVDLEILGVCYEYYDLYLQWINV